MKRYKRFLKIWLGCVVVIVLSGVGIKLNNQSQTDDKIFFSEHKKQNENENGKDKDKKN